jgi:hypothetical protein
MVRRKRVWKECIDDTTRGMAHGECIGLTVRRILRRVVPETPKVEPYGPVYDYALT